MNLEIYDKTRVLKILSLGRILAISNRYSFVTIVLGKFRNPVNIYRNNTENVAQARLKKIFLEIEPQTLQKFDFGQCLSLIFAF